jgi:hypothetical protein
MPRILDRIKDRLEALLAVVLAPHATEPAPTYTVGAPEKRIAVALAARCRASNQNTPAGEAIDREGAVKIPVETFGRPAVPPARRRTLQALVFVGAAGAVAAGASGAVDGIAGATPGLASHERYLSGLLLAIGIAFWTTLPDIGRKTARFHRLTALVVTGGLCRLAGVAMGDAVSWSSGYGLAMEVGVTPLLCLWQGWLAA